MFLLLCLMIVATLTLFIAVIKGIIELIVGSILVIVVCFMLQNRYLKSRRK